MKSAKVQYKYLSVESLKIAYREAGKKENPVLFLLHGFPSSSHMFRNMMARLSDHFYVIAPDLPGFGFSDIPTPNEFEYTFENYSKLISNFLAQLNIRKASFYLFDYGAPILMRLFVNRPEMIKMLIFQNGNIYNEGVGDILKDISKLIAEDISENSSELKKYFELDYTKWEYLNGVQNISNIAVESYMLDQFLIDREGVKEIQLLLKKDYKTNIELYSVWQDALLQLQPITLILWGENDEVFKKEGALKIKEILNHSKLIFYPTGHFALEEFGEEMTEEIISYWNLHFNTLSS
jgi:pimeloyl-ACP methyl ester carboxylesterase